MNAAHVCLAAAVLLPALAHANDAAADLTAGGVQPRTERQVAMIKERLFIGSANLQRTAPNGRTYWGDAYANRSPASWRAVAGTRKIVTPSLVRRERVTLHPRDSAPYGRDDAGSGLTNSSHKS